MPFCQWADAKSFFKDLGKSPWFITCWVGHGLVVNWLWQCRIDGTCGASYFLITLLIVGFVIKRLAIPKWNDSAKLIPLHF